jgi:hypothetical protein
MYEIWNRFPREVREKVAAEEYYDNPYATRPDPANSAGQCPLGVALYPSVLDSRPAEFMVADYFLPNTPWLNPPAEYLKICDEAEEFITDWDYGKITNIKEAVGIE